MHQHGRGSSRSRPPAVLVPAVVALLVACFVVGAAGPRADANTDVAPPVPSSPLILVYGDSLVAEAHERIESSIRFANPQADVTIRAFGGTAICDWFDQMQADISLHPDVVVIEFAGNALTPCMQLRGGSESAVSTSYLVDALAVAAQWTSAWDDTEVVFVGTPPRSVAPFDPQHHPLDRIYRRVADFGGPRVSFRVDPERALALAVDGTLRFPRHLPCTPGERAMPACQGGEIAVRADDGLHFCPVASTDGAACGVYASGMVRFGDAVADTALGALDAAVDLVSDRSAAAAP